MGFCSVSNTCVSAAEGASEPARGPRRRLRAGQQQRGNRSVPGSRPARNSPLRAPSHRAAGPSLHRHSPAAGRGRGGGARQSRRRPRAGGREEGGGGGGGARARRGRGRVQSEATLPNLQPRLQQWLPLRRAGRAEGACSCSRAPGGLRTGTLGLRLDTSAPGRLPLSVGLPLPAPEPRD